MGCFFQNWRSISCSLRGSMLCMVLYLDFHGVSRQQLFEAVGSRELSHHSHLRRRHRLLFGLWLRRLGHRCSGYRGGNSSSRAFGLSRCGACWGGAGGIGAAAGNWALVVQDQAVAVVRHGDLVSGLHIGGARGPAGAPSRLCQTRSPRRAPPLASGCLSI